MTRAKICANCKHNTLGFCTKCRCPLASATRAVTKRCPIDKW